MTNEQLNRRDDLMKLADSKTISKDQLNELETLCSDWIDEHLRALDAWADGDAAFVANNYTGPTSQKYQ